MLYAEVAIPPQGHIFAFQPVDAVQDIVSLGDFCQDGVAHFHGRRFHQQGFVTVVLEEGTHGKAAKPQCNRVSLVQHLDDFRQKVGIGKLDSRCSKGCLCHGSQSCKSCFFATVRKQTSAASRSGRQCRVNILPVSTSFVSVSQMAL